MGMTDKSLCDYCTNIGCEFQSGIVRTKCAFYIPPQLEPDNCGNYVVQDSTTKNDIRDNRVKDELERVKDELEPTTKNDLPHCQHTDEEIAKSFIEDVEAVKDQLHTKNDLGIDCISRQAVERLVWEYLRKPTEENVAFYEHFLELPSVTPQEHCEDVVSRSEVKKIAKEMYLEVANMVLDVKTISDCISYTSSKCREVLERKLQTLSSVTPQEPRKGHWIYDYTSADGHRTYHCSECGCYLQPKHSEPLNSFKWCSLCGADMREGEE